MERPRRLTLIHFFNVSVMRRGKHRTSGKADLRMTERAAINQNSTVPGGKTISLPLFVCNRCSMGSEVP